VNITEEYNENQKDEEDRDMSKFVSQEKKMSSVIRASKEIINLKLSLGELRKAVSRLEKTNADAVIRLRVIENEIRARILVVQNYIAAVMKDVTANIPFFPAITHFTQVELDNGYAIVEISMSEDGPEYFDDEGDFVERFLRYAIILHNGKTIPFIAANSQVILNEARPV